MNSAKDDCYALIQEIAVTRAKSEEKIQAEIDKIFETN